jgi:hypothetical protein
MLIRCRSRRLALAACAVLGAAATGRDARADAIVTAYSRDVVTDITLTARFPNNQPVIQRNGIATTASDIAALTSVNKGKPVSDQNATSPKTAVVGPGANGVPKPPKAKEFKLFDPHLAEGDAQIVANGNNIPTALKNQGLVNLSMPDSGLGGGSNVLQVYFKLAMADKLTVAFDANAVLYVLIEKGVVNGIASANYSMDVTILQNPGSPQSKEVFRWMPDGKKTGITGGKVNVDPFSLNDELTIMKPDEKSLPKKGVSTTFSATTGLLAGGANNLYVMDFELSESAAAGATGFNKPKEMPEPATVVLAALGLPGGILALRRRRAD